MIAILTDTHIGKRVVAITLWYSPPSSLNTQGTLHGVQHTDICERVKWIIAKAVTCISITRFDILKAVGSRHAAVCWSYSRNRGCYSFFQHAHLPVVLWKVCSLLRHWKPLFLWIAVLTFETSSISVLFWHQLYKQVETRKTNQRQCDHGRWPEANVGQEYW